MTTPLPGYERLAEVLGRALEQAQSGKGHERHARPGVPFDRQPICEIGRMTGSGGPAFQAIKKLQEATRLPRDRAVVEMLGAINYAAAAVILTEETAPSDRPTLSSPPSPLD